MMKDKLNRFSNLLARNQQPDQPASTNNRNDLLARALGGKLIDSYNGSYIKITTDFDNYYSHGKMAIDRVDLQNVFNREHYYNCEEPKKLSSDKLLFFDIETTGLGGAGAIAFLIGFASITPTGLQVRQYFLPDYSDEEALLTAVAEEISEDKIIVSYNGKSFDIPFLLDRFVLYRIAREIKLDDHIDLLYAARRMYRRRLKSCTLSNIELEILDFHRIDDIPGYLVPAIYFDWLNHDETDRVSGVVKHNLHDIVSLFFLMHHFSEIREAPTDRLSEPDDILSLAKIYDSGKKHQQAFELLESFEDITLAHDRFDIMLVRSFSYKRAGCWDDAVRLWGEIATARASESFYANIELAKYFEHKMKNFKAALECTISAERIADLAVKYRYELNNRINRLNKKISRHNS